MKKAIIFPLLFVAIIGLCFAQNVNERQLIGSWVDNEGDSWNFTADGVLSFEGGTSLKYIIANTRLVIRDNDGDFLIYYISITSDGKTIILEYIGANFTADWYSDLRKNFWLTKK